MTTLSSEYILFSESSHGLALEKGLETIYEISTIKVRLKVSEPRSLKVSDPEKAAKILQVIYEDLDVDQEHFSILALDTKLHVRGYKVLFSGGQSCSMVDPKIVFRSALLLGANRLVICHNHPAGDPCPSPEDRELTDRLERIGVDLGIEVTEHIILGADGDYYCFSKKKLSLSARSKRKRPLSTRELFGCNDRPSPFITRQSRPRTSLAAIA